VSTMSMETDRDEKRKKISIAPCGQPKGRESKPRAGVGVRQVH